MMKGAQQLPMVPPYGLHLLSMLVVLNLRVVPVEWTLSQENIVVSIGSNKNLSDVLKFFINVVIVTS